ncbi:hypothetical protein P3342_007487 [Pyrenophora teres f. teres]|nr:hypothetical protein P3342_007487 [Pyrenophora teres f. teres]
MEDILSSPEQYLTGKFVNGYGPTENTTFSTTFLVSKNEQYTNGVPIGRALSNSGAYVMDSGLRLVPLGVVGELVVTGDGLARGYTDPARNVDRFVSVEIGGKTVRAYRTGDYVRHRPTDGQLEFFGRMDGQVKIRGNRVELGEIEHTLRSDKARLAGFVTVHEDAETADEHVDDSNESQHVDVWEEKFDADIYSPMTASSREHRARLCRLDVHVRWQRHRHGEMNEWLDDTIATMLNGQRPGNVLEIGSGTGMILFNLGDGLQSYVGLDPSRKAVQFSQKQPACRAWWSVEILPKKMKATNELKLLSLASRCAAYPANHGERRCFIAEHRPAATAHCLKTQQRPSEDSRQTERFLPQYMVPGCSCQSSSDGQGRSQAPAHRHTEGQSGEATAIDRDAGTMQQLWAGVLAIDADSIGLDDSFFRLGGDSIAAMKLVGEARRAGIHLTVADLFRNPKLECLSRIGRKLLHRIVEPVLSFSLLPPAIKEDILSNQKSLGKINDLASIVDILPVTHCQKFFLSRGQHDPRIAFNYFYVEMGPQLDLYLLRNSCRKVLDHLSILRSLRSLDDQWFQIILHDLDLPFSVHDVNESLDEASHAICMQDIERTDPLEVPTSFKVVRYKSTHNRLIIRLSHAQYDGVSFPIILRTLISIYQQEPLHPVAEFSTFLAHARKIQTLSGRYWRELLQGSRPIRVTEKLRLQVQEDISPV